jgi:selenocysteine-specific elongation factor
LGFSLELWERLKSIALEALADRHRRAPNAVGPSEDRLFFGTPVRLPHEAVVAIAAELVADGAIIRERTGVRLPAHRPTLSPADAAFWQRVGPLLERQPLHPPSIHEMATSLGTDAKTLDALLARIARLGLLVRLTPSRFIRPEALRQLGEMAATLAAQSPDQRVTAAAFRDFTGVGRNLAIDLLEYFDRVKLTRRVGDAHEILRPVEQAF